MTNQNVENNLAGYELVIQLHTKNPHSHKIEILDWLFTTIEMPERSCEFTWTDSIVKIKFKYQRDYVFARLRW